MMNNFEMDDLRNLSIGTIESISPKEIKILLDINTPQNIALNTGSPILFPKINGYVLIPNELGFLVGIISWIGIEHSPYPKRQGFKDFNLVDLPFPLRKMYINPLGVLKKENNLYKIERGVYSFPTVGDHVIIPTAEQLEAIVKNRDEIKCIKIGVSPLAANSPIFVNPDKLFGRHVAVLGNTGSGKSCSVAGLIRWSIESARKNIKNGDKINSRFIILDPNGEYLKIFDDLSDNVRKFNVSFGNIINDKIEQLKVPVWMWNSYEWCSISQATLKTQKPILKNALKEVKSKNYTLNNFDTYYLKGYLKRFLNTIRSYINQAPNSLSDFIIRQNIGGLLESTLNSLKYLKNNPFDLQKDFTVIISQIEKVLESRKPDSKNNYPVFDLSDLKLIEEEIIKLYSDIDDIKSIKGPNEDSPIYFKDDDFIFKLTELIYKNNYQQIFDFFLMRIQTILSDERMASVVGSKEKINLNKWLEDYIGSNNGENGEITIIDLSLVPSDILNIIVAVISRIIFEALQRYRKLNGKVLPTVLVMEEAHNFISKYNYENDEITSSKLCTQSFEKIAKEGRKFGLGLVLSSQRPSELSQTVLSQCNTFLLHRIVNDRDQELVKKMVPDNLGSILNELPVLPTRKAILLGWAAPIPILVEMDELKKNERPHSDDPDFWDVWIGKNEREIDWEKIVKDWQNEG